ncbi:MAG: hypothetical protein U1A72_21765 [Sulfuritalea sp.]|nr:hypothetical protein [Sulfuritalea sp.]
MGQQLVLQGLAQDREFGGKIVVKEYGPTHARIMDLKTYLIKQSDGLKPPCRQRQLLVEAPDCTARPGNSCPTASTFIQAPVQITRPQDRS